VVTQSIGLDLIGGVLSGVVHVPTIVDLLWYGVCVVAAAVVEFIVVTGGTWLKCGTWPPER
jgi:hypothetical protein